MGKRKKMLVADLLCGAGGSSTGAARALKELGLEMELVCLNHWPTAIETHSRNHPEARHYVQDIATVRPHLIVPEGYLDLLMASPTCTHHSVARGGKPTSDQQRSDPWHIITWLTELRVKRMIIENVWEFISWGPVDPRTGKPIKSRKGEYFQAWIKTIQGLGFDPEWRKLNAADYGDATTRQRFILIARSDGRKLLWPVATHQRRELVENSLLPELQPWRPAREIIDWSIRGKSIFGRPRPLAPKTLIRIYAGAVKFGWPEPFRFKLLAEIERSLRYVIGWSFARRNTPIKVADRRKRRKDTREFITRYRTFLAAPEDFVANRKRAEPLVVTLRQNLGAATADDPIKTVSAGGRHVGLAEPVVISTRQHTGGPAPRSAGEPVPTLTASDSRIGYAQPVIVNMKGRSTASSSGEPLPTQTAHAPHLFAAEPIVLSQHNSGAPRSTNDPLPTITTGGAATEDHPGCARPMLVTVAHGNDAREKDPNTRRSNSIEDPLGTIHGDGSTVAVVEPFILNRHGEGYGETRAHSVDDPAPTANCDGGGYVVEPFVLSRHAGGAPRSVDDPTPTQVAKQSHVLVSPYYGSGSGETCKSAEDPLPTATAKARFGIVVPVTHTQGGNASRTVDEPIPTLTTAKGGEFAVVVPVTHAGGTDRVRDANTDPLPTVTGANRGELAFIAAQFGEREGQAPRVHDIGDPTPTIAATGHINLVEPDDAYDVLFRMLEPHELAAAMGFNSEDETYEFAGTKTEQIKQIGNAVSVAKMKACVKAIMADAAPAVGTAPAAEERAA